MKKALLTIILFGVLLIGLNGCSISKKPTGSEPLKNHGNVVFSIRIGDKDCVPVRLTVYEDGIYELFTAYKACKPGKNCNSILKYSKSEKGSYNYDVFKIIENSVDANEKTYSMDNLPEYELYTETQHYYTIEKGQTNKYLDEFLKKIDVDLKVCAEREYIG